MNHNLKATLVIIFLLSVTTYLGLILTNTSLGNFMGGNEGLTGGSVAENCQGEECVQPIVGCGEDRSGYACRIVCHSNEECDDGISQTDDICRNPSTVKSLCVNRIIR